MKLEPMKESAVRCSTVKVSKTVGVEEMKMADEWWMPDQFEVVDSQSNETLKGMRERLTRNNQLRAQYGRARSRSEQRGTSPNTLHVVQIPLVVLPKQQSKSLDDAEVVVIGDAVTWPEGTAKRILLGELRVATAIFQVQKRENASNKRKSDRNERSRRHSEMDITIHQSDAQGVRDSMQDRYVIHLFNGIAVFGLFDGHGGTLAAEFASRAFIPALKAQFKKAQDRGISYTFTDSNPQPPDAIERETIESIKGSLRDAIAEIERELLELLRSRKDYSGTTLCVCLCTPSTLLVANLGDSRVVVSRKGVPKVITKDHQVSDPNEVQRIHDENGFVNSEGYVGGLVQVSRALGDIDPNDVDAKKIVGLSAKPDIFEFPLDKDKDEFIIVACDGLWEVMSNQGAVQQVRSSLKLNKGNMLQTADDLVEKALGLKTKDNVTVLIAFFPVVDRIRAPPLVDSPSLREDTDRPRLFLKKS